MSETDQIFEFKGNALIHFHVRLRATSLAVSTAKKRGGPAVKTWDVDFARIRQVRIAERHGSRTRRAGLYITPQQGELIMFGWQRNALGAPRSEASTYYAAAIATLRALAAHRPDLKVTIGPFGTSTLVGLALWATAYVAAAFFLIGEINTTFWATAGGILAIYGISALSSGSFEKTREISLTEAADELEAKSKR